VPSIRKHQIKVLERSLKKAMLHNAPPHAQKMTSLNTFFFKKICPPQLNRLISISFLQQAFYCKTVLNMVMDVPQDEEDDERDTRNDSHLKT
jgi:hypothetical protein